MVGTRWTISASGVIDLEAADRLESLVNRYGIPRRSSLYLHSPGGSLLGGLLLGRKIRELGLFTHVGQYVQSEVRSLVPGYCYSAAALAFLGGTFRWIDKKSSYGVHRFSFTEDLPDASDRAQVLSAVVVQYLRDMDVDPGLFNKMTIAGRESMLVLDQEDLAKYRVTHTGYEDTKWTLESIRGYLYLKGERVTPRGMNKFIIACQGGSVTHVMVLFDPEGRSDEIRSMQVLILNIDEERVIIQISDRRTPKMENGIVNCDFTIDDATLRKMMNARSVGVCFQYTVDSPFFLGFDRMDISSGIDKLKALINNCR